MTKSEIRTIKYHFTDIGSITYDLYNISTTIYNYLEDNKIDERLKNISQLGVISRVYQCANHSRWDYINLQLFILHRMRSNEIINTTDVVKINENQCSKIELLQSWILLSNIGHMYGTFSSEMAILELCKSNKKIKNCILRGLPKNNENIKKYFIDNLEENQIFKIFNVLTYYQLERNKKNYNEYIPVFENLLDYYHFDSNYPKKTKEKIEILKKYYKIIRQLAYIYLDTQYSIIPIKIQMSTILFNINQYFSNKSIINENSFKNTLDSLDEYLEKNIYHSPESLNEFAINTKGLINYTNSDPNFKDIINHKKIIELLEKEHENKIKKYYSNDMINFRIDNRIMKSLIKKNRNTLTSSFEKRYNNKTSLLFIIESPAHRDSIMNISFSNKIRFNKKIEIIRFILDNLFNYFDKFPVRYNRYRDKYYSMYNNLKKVLKYTLKIIIKDNIDIKLVENSINSYSDNHFYLNHYKMDYEFIVSKGAKNASKLLDKKTKAIDISKLEDKSRYYELCCMRDALSEIKFRNRFYVSLNNIIIGKNNRNLCELDGIAFGFKNKKICLLIVESKKTKSGGSTKAKKDLREKLKKMNLSYKTDEINKINYGAYVYIEL